MRHLRHAEYERPRLDSGLARLGRQPLNPPPKPTGSLVVQRPAGFCGPPCVSTDEQRCRAKGKLCDKIGAPECTRIIFNELCQNTHCAHASHATQGQTKVPAEASQQRARLLGIQAGLRSESGVLLLLNTLGTNGPLLSSNLVCFTMRL